jgi:hypothetical protein
MWHTTQYRNQTPSATLENKFWANLAQPRSVLKVILLVRLANLPST